MERNPLPEICDEPPRPGRGSRLDPESPRRGPVGAAAPSHLPALRGAPGRGGRGLGRAAGSPPRAPPDKDRILSGWERGRARWSRPRPQHPAGRAPPRAPLSSGPARFGRTSQTSPAAGGTRGRAPGWRRRTDADAGNARVPAVTCPPAGCGLRSGRRFASSPAAPGAHGSPQVRAGGRCVGLPEAATLTTLTGRFTNPGRRSRSGPSASPSCGRCGSLRVPVKGAETRPRV